MTTVISPDLAAKTLEQLYITLDAICINNKLFHSISYVTTSHSGIKAMRVKKPYYILEVNGIKKLVTLRDYDRATLLRNGIVAVKEALKKRPQ